VVLLGAPGCGVLEPELPFELPEENTSTDPNALRVGLFVYPCGDWRSGNRPPDDYLLVDVFFRLEEAGDPPEVDRPTLAQRRLVEILGGVILRSYYLAGMRVWLPTDGVPVLEDSGATVLSVPEPRRYDTTMHIDFVMGTDFHADSLRIVDLGGEVLRGAAPIPGFPPTAFVILPNRAVPELRARPTVIRVIYSGVPNCL
jgi:hypothetical protein